MACCAFAAFLISQLFLMGERLRALAGLSARPVAANPNAMWRLGAPMSPQGPAGRRRRFHLGVTALSICAGLASGALLEACARGAGLDPTGLICTKDGLVRLARAP